jgi:hypothetical protein
MSGIEVADTHRMSAIAYEQRLEPCLAPRAERPPPARLVTLEENTQTRRFGLTVVGLLFTLAMLPELLPHW